MPRYVQYTTHSKQIISPQFRLAATLLKTTDHRSTLSWASKHREVKQRLPRRRRETKLADRSPGCICSCRRSSRLGIRRSRWTVVPCSLLNIHELRHLATGQPSSLVSTTTHQPTYLSKSRIKPSTRTHPWATRRHLPYGITQCYLPPDTSEFVPSLKLDSWQLDCMLTLAECDCQSYFVLIFCRRQSCQFLRVTACMLQRVYATPIPSVCLSIRLSVRPSQACIVSKRLNVSSKFFHRLIGLSF